MTLVFQAPRGLTGRITPPADKSITHRALILAGLANGCSRVHNPLDTGDCLSTRSCLKALGVAVERGHGVMARSYVGWFLPRLAGGCARLG